MEEWIKVVRERTEKGKAPIAAGRSNKFGRISFDDLVFMPAQLAATPIDYFKEKISSETIIGKKTKHPLKLKTPIIMAAMSFGALSDKAKLSLAIASSAVGTATNTGEGGMLPEERKNAKILIGQYSTGRFGIDENYFKNSDAIEIKIGQGAKPGQGGLLPAAKVTEKVAKVRNLPVGKAIHSPPCHTDIKNIKQLHERVEEIRGKIDGRPIILKLGAGDMKKDIPLAVEANPDVIAIDGMSGGTGAAPKIMLNDFGNPTVSALTETRKILDDLGAKQELIVGGGLNKGADVAKALALGADAVFMGTALLGAMGCINCGMCYLGKCPQGIVTQDPKLIAKLNKDKAAHGIVSFIDSCTEEVKMAAAATGKRDIHKLNRDDLRSMTLLIRELTGVPLV